MIKTKALLISLLLFVSAMLNAQDTIKLKNGLVLYGLITDTNNGEIKFRIDGGIVSLDQVLSYHKDGQTKIVNAEVAKQAQKTPAGKPEECETKNIGDVKFVNKLSHNISVNVYTNGINPDGLEVNNTTNSLIAEITVPANGEAMAYDLSAGVHYVLSSFGRGQVKVTKCGVATFTFK